MEGDFATKISPDPPIGFRAEGRDVRAQDDADRFIDLALNISFMRSLPKDGGS